MSQHHIYHRSTPRGTRSGSAAGRRVRDAGCIRRRRPATDADTADPGDPAAEPKDHDLIEAVGMGTLSVAGADTSQTDPSEDSVLIEAVRAGDLAALDALYRHHVAAAYRQARQLAPCPAAVDDLVSEAFAKVVGILRAGHGPDRAFRAYLLTTIRHLAFNNHRRDRKIEYIDRFDGNVRVPEQLLAVPFHDTAIHGLQRALAAEAFARLPERWQAVLWHTEIESQSPAKVASILGLTANGVSALAYRAREGLRQAYLQVHLAETTDRHCRAAAERLGAWARDALAKREKAKVERHLDGCSVCKRRAAELATENSVVENSVGRTAA